jgi:dienelactone hydrolase
MKRIIRIFSLIVLLHLLAGVLVAQSIARPQAVLVNSGSLRLRALLWQPKGQGPFPAVLFCPGSGLTPQPETIGPVFARHGYVLIALLLSGQGLSARQGSETSVLVEQERAAKGDDAANRLQLSLLEGDQLEQQLNALKVLRSLKIVDPTRVALVGHSFGGMLAMLNAERDSSIRAVVNFGGGARSWPRSSYLRDRVSRATSSITTPVFFIQAANDYSVEPSEVLDAALARRGIPHQLRIFPPFGKTAAEGHNIIYLSVASWEKEVFEFLERYTQRAG